MLDCDISISALPVTRCGSYAEPLVAKVGENIKAVRMKLGLTQQEMSDACDIPQNRISTWESGKVEPTVSSLLKVCAGLNQPLEVFVSGVNRAFDLSCHKRDQESDLSTEGVQANVPAAARMELQRLNDLVTRYKAQARKVLEATDNLDTVVTALEEIGAADQRTARRGGRARKAS
jgi:transcriptional regulator with XRE-family HTH domain